MSYNAYCAISKEGDNDIWSVRPRGVVPLLPLCSQIDVGATDLGLGDPLSRENNTHGSRFHDRDPQIASRILGAMTQSFYIGTRDIRSRVIRGPYCIWVGAYWFSVTSLSKWPPCDFDQCSIAIHPPIAHCPPLLWGGGILVDHWSTISSFVLLQAGGAAAMIEHYRSLLETLEEQNPRNEEQIALRHEHIARILWVNHFHWTDQSAFLWLLQLLRFESWNISLMQQFWANQVWVSNHFL